MIPGFLSRRISGPIVSLALVVWLVVGMLLFQVGPFQEVMTLQPAGAEILDQRMGYTVGDAAEYLDALGEEGRNAYGRFLLWDMLNGLVMGGAFFLTLIFVASRLGLGGHWIAVVVYAPLVTGALDVIENATLLRVLAMFPEPAPAAVSLASLVTQGKLVAGLIGSVAVLGGLAVLGVKAILGSKRGPVTRHQG